ncbi:MAG: gliding motility protein GldC [Saprospiraceae bacterium]|nr:gliding motility protein GldC [Saprospiraceae bacterium]
MDDKTVVKESTIQINIGLNAENIPIAMDWFSTDNPDKIDVAACKAMLLSLFDSDHKDTLKIDLWTNEMQVQEMDRFMFQTMRGLADTYFKATQNKDLAVDMQKFVQYFGEKTELIPKS